MVAGAGAQGFFGKLPARGDFVTRGLPNRFLDAWEVWVARAIAASRELLDQDWDTAWMVAPIWRFCLPAGACGPDPAVGLMMPSVDRVGRCYPLMIATVFAGAQGVPDSAEAIPFLDAAEDAARAALADDLEPEMLAERIAAAPLAGLPILNGSATWWTDGAPAVPAATLVLDGMPPMPDHAAMLAGDGTPRGACL